MPEVKSPAITPAPQLQFIQRLFCKGRKAGLCGSAYQIARLFSRIKIFPPRDSFHLLFAIDWVSGVVNLEAEDQEGVAINVNIQKEKDK